MTKNIAGTVARRPTDRVLIVGAGPTGLTAAAFFVKQNIDFDIIDIRQGPVDESRALGVHARTLEFMSMFGLDGEFVSQGNPTRYMTFHRGNRRLFKLDFDTISDMTKYPYMLILPQANSERILVRHLEQQGVDIRWGAVLDDFVQDDTGVAVTINGPDGKKVAQRYAFVIGCDGASSLVRTKLGIPFEGETYPLRFLLSEVEIEGNAIDQTSSHVFMGEKTTVAVLPQPNSIYRIVGPDFSKISGDASGQTPVEFADFEDFLRTNDLLQHVTMQKPSRLVSYRVQKRVAAGFGSGRVFIAGDAAHIHSPAGGQGMNTGLNDVANLTWKIAAVLRGRAEYDLLETYTSERRPAALSVVNNADAAMMKVVSRKLPNRLFFDYVAPGLSKIYQPRRLLAAMAQISLTYHVANNSTDRVSAAAPRLGSRLADYSLRSGGTSNSRLGGCNHVAFISGSGRDVELMKEQLALRSKDTSAEVCELAKPITQKEQQNPFNGVVVVRPDGYVVDVLAAGRLARFVPGTSSQQKLRTA